MLNASKLLERAAVITLAKRPERCLRFLERYAAATGGATLRIVYGYDGQRLPIPDQWGTTAGAFGACLAHVAAWARVLSDTETDETTPLLFFEDDAVFVDGFIEKLDKAAKMLPPDWDVLYLGGEYLAGRPLGQFVTQSGSGVELLRACNVNRLHAYCVRAGAMRVIFPRLLAYLTNAPKVSGPTGDETCFDYEFGRMMEGGVITAYSCVPWLCGQGGFGSDTYPTTDATQVRFWDF